MEKNNCKTVIVLVSDNKYFNKAKRTIIDIRSKGEWNKDLVLITIDFDLNNNFKDFYNVIEVKLPYLNFKINEKLKNKCYENSDKREIEKINQWQKLNVFNPYFKKWDKVIFFDAGFRILDKIKYYDEIEFENYLVAPLDNNGIPLEKIFSQTYIEDYNQYIQDYGTKYFKEGYLMNCMFLYDTKILNLFDFDDFINEVDKYTIWRLNEMSYMNFYFYIKLDIWKKMPEFIYNDNGEKKVLYEWCEINRPGTNWRYYVGIKYPPQKRQ